MGPKYFQGPFFLLNIQGYEDIYGIYNRNDVMEAQRETDTKLSFQLSNFYSTDVQAQLLLDKCIIKGRCDTEKEVEISVTFRFTREFLKYMGTYFRFSITMLAARTINVSYYIEYDFF